MPRDVGVGGGAGGGGGDGESMAKHIGYLQLIRDKEDVLYPSQVLLI